MASSSSSSSSSSSPSQSQAAIAKKFKVKVMNDMDVEVQTSAESESAEVDGVSALGELVFSNHLLIEGIYSALDFGSRKSLTQVNWACNHAQHAKFMEQYSRKPAPFKSFCQVKKFIVDLSDVPMILHRKPETKFPKGGALTLEGVEILEIRNPTKKPIFSFPAYPLGGPAPVPAKFVAIVLRIFPNLREIVQEVPQEHRSIWKKKSDRGEMLEITKALLDALRCGVRPVPVRRLKLEIDSEQIWKIGRLAVDLEHLELTNATKEGEWGEEDWESLRTALLRHAGTLEVLRLPVILYCDEVEVDLDFPPLPQLKVLELNFARMNFSNRWKFPPLSFSQLENQQLNYPQLFPNLHELVIRAGGWIPGEKVGVGRQWTEDILRTFFPVSTPDLEGPGQGHKKLRRLKIQTCGFLEKWERYNMENEEMQREERKRNLRKSIKQIFPALKENNIILDGKPYKTP